MLAIPLCASSIEKWLLGVGHLWWAGGSEAGPGNRADVSGSTRSKIPTFPSHAAQVTESEIETGS